MLNPFIELISSALSLYNLAIIVWAIIGLLMHFEVINRFNPFVQRIYQTLTQIIEPLLRPIRRVMRRYLPALGGVDLSVIVLILLIQFAQSALYNWL